MHFFNSLYLHIINLKLKIKTMFQMLGVKTKKDKSILIKGLALGIFAGAFLPDKYNPVVLIKGMLNKASY